MQVSSTTHHPSSKERYPDHLLPKLLYAFDVMHWVKIKKVNLAVNATIICKRSWISWRSKMGSMVLEWVRVNSSNKYNSSKLLGITLRMILYLEGFWMARGKHHRLIIKRSKRKRRRKLIRNSDWLIFLKI